MYYITTDARLREYVPNVFTSVEGEVSLFDKMKTHLQFAESWLEQTIVGETTMAAIADQTASSSAAASSAASSTATPVPLHDIICQIIVSEAFRKAVPSLDLVLTPNGFGIVSNQNIAPASKERVDRLLAALETTRDDCIELLLRYLPGENTWAQESCSGYRYFRSTLFPNIDVTRSLDIKEHRLERYQSLHPRIQLIESQMAAEWISTEQMEVLRTESIMGNGSALHTTIISRLRALVLSLLRNDSQRDFDPHSYGSTLSEIVQIIRTNESEFPEWHASSTKELFDPPKFENKKQSSGYWF